MLCIPVWAHAIVLSVIKTKALIFQEDFLNEHYAAVDGEIRKFYTFSFFDFFPIFPRFSRLSKLDTLLHLASVPLFSFGCFWKTRDTNSM